MTASSYGALDLELCSSSNSDSIQSLEEFASAKVGPPSQGDDRLSLSTSWNSLHQLSNRGKLLLILIVSAHFFHMTAFSLLAPFFPQEAQAKGLSSTVTGLIFSTFMFIAFIVSPIYGAHVSRIGPKFMFCAGLSVGGICAILFGLLEYSPRGSSFIVLCFLTRILEAAGLTSFSTASFAVVSSQFTHMITTAFGALETAKSVGFILGPAFGSFLYEIGGFGLPFYVTGCLICLNGVALLKFLPAEEYADVSKKDNASTFSMLKSAQIFLALASIFLSCLSIGFIDSNLSLHLKHFNISSYWLGLIFSLWSSLYCIVTPLVGWLCDRKNLALHEIILGNLLSSVAFFFLGPITLLHILPSTLWPNLMGLCIAGLAEACVFIPAIKCMVEGARSMGYPDNVESFGLVSGLYQSIYSLGSLCGPFFGGLLTEMVGFEATSAIFTGLFMVKAIILLVYLSFRSRSSQLGNKIVTEKEFKPK